MIGMKMGAQHKIDRFGIDSGRKELVEPSRLKTIPCRCRWSFFAMTNTAIDEDDVVSGSDDIALNTTPERLGVGIPEMGQQPIHFAREPVHSGVGEKEGGFIAQPLHLDQAEGLGHDQHSYRRG